MVVYEEPLGYCLIICVVSVRQLFAFGFRCCYGVDCLVVGVVTAVGFERG